MRLGRVAIVTSWQDEFEVELDGQLYGRPMLQGLRCSAQTSQLAVIDAMKDRHMSNLMAKARYVAKKLRTQNVGAVLKKMGHKRAIIDCITRWHSTHDMLERLCEISVRIWPLASRSCILAQGRMAEDRCFSRCPETCQNSDKMPTM